jgi:hypothetical protein
MMRKNGDVAGVELQEVSVSGDTVTSSVIVDGRAVGTVEFMTYYEPVVKVLEPYIALWAGPTLCVIDRAQRTMHCLDRGDETHGIHSFERLWIVEGEINVDLFDPHSEATLATYYHNEVITGSTLTDGLVRIRDLAGVEVTLDARRSLQVVR